jgi:hypothetical protein
MTQLTDVRAISRMMTAAVGVGCADGWRLERQCS